MSDTVEQRVARIRSVQLKSNVKVSATDDSACVVGPSVISFVGGLTIQQRNDVMNSTLWAQMAANKLFNRLDETQKDQWYDKYRSFLEMLGWVVTSSSFTDLQGVGAMGSVDAAVLSFMTSVSSSAQIAALKLAIDQLKKPANTVAHELFKTVTWNTTKADFHVGVCQADANGSLAFRIGAFRYDSSGSNSDVLYCLLGFDVVGFKSLTQDMVLNDQLYGMHRNEVLAALGTAVSTSIANIQI